MTDSPVTKLPLRVKDITGQKFGKLTAVRFVEFHQCPNGDRKPKWEFRCDCGETAIQMSADVKRKWRKNPSCGCNSDPENLTGQKFYMLTAIRRIEVVEFRSKTRKINHYKWEFLCDCGRTKTALANHVKMGRTRSCGCLLEQYYQKRRSGGKMTPAQMYRKHRQKRLASQQIYRVKNAEKIRAFVRKNRDYYRLKASAYRVKVRSKSERTDVILAWLKRIKSKKVRCYYCGEVIPKGKLDIDHVIPVIENGPHSVENLAAACSHCNRTKSRKLIKDWERIGQQILPL